MSNTNAATVDGAKLPFSEQIKFFQAKLNLPTDSYADLAGKDHDYAFVVAGANRNDILVDFRKAVDKAIAEGTTLREFRKDFDNIISKYGWNYNGGRNWRSRIIYDTNLYSSFSAGRYEQHQRMKKLRPFWEYRHRDGLKYPRPLHVSWNGIVLPADDPWWQTHYPINAYGCHCSVIAHSARSLEREGLTVSQSPTINYVTKQIGVRSGNPRTVTLPEGIDYGFDRIPNTNRVDMPSKLLLDKAISVPPQLASNMVANVLKVPEVKKLLAAEVKQMVDRIADDKLARGVSKSVGVLPADVVKKLTDEGLPPATAVITLRDTDVLHAIRDDKDDKLPFSFWYNLVEHLQQPEAILLDNTQSDNALIYIVTLPNNKGKAIIKLDYEIKVRDDKGKKQRITTNIIRSGKTFVYNEKMKQGFEQYDVLYGEITNLIAE